MNGSLIKYLSIILALILLSCGREELEGYNIDEYYDCHEDDNWSVLEVRKALEGTWDWEFIECYSGASYQSASESLGVTLEFKEDSRLIIRDTDGSEQELSWQVFSVIGDYYEIETEPPNPYTWGIILVCNNQLVFTSSPYDGCDQYYSKN